MDAKKLILNWKEEGSQIHGSIEDCRYYVTPEGWKYMVYTDGESLFAPENTDMDTIYIAHLPTSFGEMEVKGIVWDKDEYEWVIVGIECIYEFMGE